MFRKQRTGVDASHSKLDDQKQWRIADSVSGNNAEIHDLDLLLRHQRQATIRKRHFRNNERQQRTHTKAVVKLQRGNSVVFPPGPTLPPNQSFPQGQVHAVQHDQSVGNDDLSELESLLPTSHQGLLLYLEYLYQLSDDPSEVYRTGKEHLLQCGIPRQMGQLDSLPPRPNPTTRP